MDKNKKTSYLVSFVLVLVSFAIIQILILSGIIDSYWQSILFLVYKYNTFNIIEYNRRKFGTNNLGTCRFYVNRCIQCRNFFENWNNRRNTRIFYSLINWRVVCIFIFSCNRNTSIEVKRRLSCYSNLGFWRNN